MTESNSYISISENSGTEKIILNYVVSQNPENTLQDNFRVRGTLSNVNVHDSSGELPSSVDNMDNKWSLIKYTLRDSLNAGDRSKVTVEFTKLVENLDGNCTYRISYEWSTLPTSYQIITKLPKGSSLTSVSKSPSELYTENESLYLRYSGVMTNAFQSHITFTKPPSEEAPTGEKRPSGEGQQEKGGRTLLPYAIPAIVGVVTLFVIWGIRRTREIKPPKKLEKPPKAMPRPDIKKILRTFHENERKVIETLIEKDNLTQSKLCSRTDIPKSTMSRILQGLEQKGVVRRTKHGMSKRVALTRWIKEWRREKS